jgi:hypothetical protein
MLAPWRCHNRSWDQHLLLVIKCIKLKVLLHAAPGLHGAVLTSGKHAASAGRSLLPCDCTALLHTRWLLSKYITFCTEHAIFTWTPAEHPQLLLLLPPTLCSQHTMILLALKQVVPVF